MTSSTDVSTERFFNRDEPAFITAVKESNLPIRDKFLLRGMYMVPGIRSSVDDYIASKASAAGKDVTTMADGELIKFIIEHLPEIAEFIKLIISLF